MEVFERDFIVAEFYRLAGTKRKPPGLRDTSKRDSSTAWCGSFAGANENEKAAPLRSDWVGG
jgi:hypothetical protein